MSAPTWVLHGLQPPSVQIHLTQCMYLYGLQHGDLFHQGTPWAAEGRPAPPLSFPWAVGKLLLWHLQHLPLLHWPWCLQGCFSLPFLTPLSQLLLCNSLFYPFLNLLSKRRNRVTHWLGFAQWQAPFEASWNWILSNMGQLMDSSHRGLIAASPTNKTLQCKPNTKRKL